MEQKSHPEKQMTVEIIFPLLVLAASAATIAFAISYRTKSRVMASSASAVNGYSASGADAVFIDPPKAVSQSSLMVAPASQVVVADAQPAYISTSESSYNTISEPTLLPSAGQEAEPHTSAAAVEVRTEPTLPDIPAPRGTRKGTRSRSSQGRRTRRKVSQPAA